MLTQIHVQVREGNRRGSHELFPLKGHGRARKNRENEISQGGLKTWLQGWRFGDQFVEYEKH